MPPRSKRTVRSRTDYTVAHLYQLASGHDLFTEAWGKDPAPTRLMRGWEDLGADLVRLHIVHYPGTRPWAWWMCVAPERRQRVDGQPHPHDDGSVPERYRQLWYGLPRTLHTEGHFGAVYESQPAYLLRVRLLTPAERRALDAVDAEDSPMAADPPTLSRDVLKACLEEQP